MSRKHTSSTNTSHIRKGTVLWWVMRWVWMGLAAIHFWPLATLLLKCIRTPSVLDVLGLGSLLLVIIFFALKAFDVPSLRFRRPGLEFLTFLIVTALIHGDAIPSRYTPALTAETVATFVVASGGVIVGGRRFGKRFAELLTGFARRNESFRLALDLLGVVQLPSLRFAQQVACRCAPARAPPFAVH